MSLLISFILAPVVLPQVQAPISRGFVDADLGS